jgi:hypothetical protein
LKLSGLTLKAPEKQQSRGKSIRKTFLRAAVLIEKRLPAADDTRGFSETEYYLFLLRYLER